ncbi:MAG: pyridoxamine 5'-phosphate oxidase family protein [Phycisphaerae bacterium]|nr:pyridoxamine 5'-phosphate oxidase family protein [Phycisphaerae bacterium]
MESRTDLRTKLKALFDKQRLGVLSTQKRNRPYASLVAFAVTDDLKSFVFATPRTTRKYANIMASSRAALLIDNRSNRASDFRKAMAVTVVGTVRELRKSQRSRLIRLYTDKHSHLEDFVRSPTCAVMCIDAETLHIVDQFQHVIELRLSK